MNLIHNNSYDLLFSMLEDNIFSASKLELKFETDDEDQIYFLKDNSIILIKDSKITIINREDDVTEFDLPTDKKYTLSLHGKLNISLQSDLASIENPVMLNLDGDIKIYGNKFCVYSESSSFISKCSRIESLNIADLSYGEIPNYSEIVELSGSCEYS